MNQLRRIHLAYVDDSPADRRQFSILIADCLEGVAAVDIKLFDSPPRSLEALAPFDGVLLDYDLKIELNGLSFAQRIRSLMPLMPIALMTGMDGYLLKSIGLDYVDSIIDKNDPVEAAQQIRVFARWIERIKVALGRRESLYRLNGPHKRDSLSN